MSEHILESISYFKPEIALTITLCTAIIADLLLKRKNQYVSVVVLAGLAVTTLLVFRQTGTNVSIFSDMIAVDPFAVFFKVVLLVSAFFIVVFSVQSRELDQNKFRIGEYYMLITAMVLGMFIMAGAANLLLMYLALELTSISSYILAGYTKRAKDSAEASLKYVIYGAVSSGMLIYGVSILYGLTGATDIYGINEVLQAGTHNPIALLTAGILIIAGFGYKVTIAPFHFWSPDVYEGAPVTITAFLAVASKAAGFAMMVRFFKVSFIDSYALMESGVWDIIAGFQWNIILAVMAVLTMTIGNLVAIWQNNLKRLLAYSSIAHAGYILMGLVVLTDEGISAMMIYFVVYLFMNLGAFYVIMLIANKLGTEDIDDYKGLGYRSPLVCVAMAIFLVSLTGLPPTAGFIGKLYIFGAVISAGWYGLALIAAINSVIALYYYVRIFRNMFLVQPEPGATNVEFGFAQKLVLFLLLIPTLLFGLYFSPIIDFAQSSVTMFGF
jgi:NADH-quinone oxidoreductase subunit N